MRATINSINLEFSKEEMIALLIEVKELNQKAKSSDNTKDQYPLMVKLEKVLNDSYDVGEISALGTTFNLIPRQ